MTDTLVSFSTTHGVRARGTLVRLSRAQAVFEVYSAGLVLQTSEVLEQFRIVCQDRTVYLGQGVVRSAVEAGGMTLCEVSLDKGWIDVDFTVTASQGERLRASFEDFYHQWQNGYKVAPEFKATIGDFHSFLSELRLWLEQIELGIRSSPSGESTALERQVVDELSDPIIRAIDQFIDRFEALAAGVPRELQPAHRTFLRRQLHPILLCSPFAHRAYFKPLGYAGDYEIVNMMLRPPQEGSSLFAKIINVWLLRQAPVQAHRNRVEYLSRKLLEEAARLRGSNRPGRVYSLGCGPALEVQNFLREFPMKPAVQFTLADFNEETLADVRAKLDKIQAQTARLASVEYVRRSVHQIIKEGGRLASSATQRYDFIYCAGLYDYLEDKVCKRLNTILYEQLAPGGLLLYTNVTDAMNASRPFRHSMEYILDWHLLYRNGPAVAALAPAGIAAEEIQVTADETAVNVFVQIRRR